MDETMSEPRRIPERAPVIELARIRRIRTIEVMETELDTIDQIVAAEQTALGFFTGTLGAFLGAAFGWLGASGLTPMRQVLFATATLVTGIFTVWFFAQWRLARRRRPTLLTELRSRAR